VKNALVLALSALVLFLGGSAWLCLFPAIPADLGGVRNLDSEARRVAIPVGEGEHVGGWVLRGSNRAVIVLLPGYARDHRRVWRYAQFLKPDGYTIVAVDFRSALSTHRRPTTLGAFELEDAEAVLRWVLAQPKWRQARIGLFGESMGASVALAAAAADTQVAAIAADCPFATGEMGIRDAFACQLGLPAQPLTGMAMTVGRIVTRRDFAALDSRAALTSMRARPVLLIQTARGDRFSPEQVRELEAAAGPGAEGWTVTDSRHNAIWVDHRRDYETRVRAFFAQHLLGSRTWTLERVDAPAPAAKAKP